jgi:hypothetical protein
MAKLQPRPPKRTRGFTRYKRSDVARAIYGVEDTGKSVERVEIDPATGKIIIVPKSDTPGAQNNDLDSWLKKKDAHQA